VEIVTITDKAKEGIARLCNESVVIEYDMILNYPRIIDHIRNFEKINDEQLLNALEQLGKESLGHFGNIDRMIKDLGGETIWVANTLPRLVGIVDILGEQLAKEKAVRDIYQEAKKIAANNKTTVKSGGFFTRLRVKDMLEKNFVSFENITRDLDRLIWDEERHARIVEDSIATFKSLLSKRGKL